MQFDPAEDKELAGFSLVKPIKEPKEEALAMSTETLAPPSRRYHDLIEQLPLRPIRSEDDHQRAIAMMRTLIRIEQPNHHEADYLDVLGTLIEAYEAEECPLPALSEAELLRHFLDSRGVTQVQLANATEVPESTISSILSGRRGISKGNVAAFARFFKISASVFLNR